MQYILKDKDISYQVQYSKRSKMDLSISPEGLILIKAPLKTTKEDLEGFLDSQSKTILSFLQRFESREFINAKKEYEEDSNFLFLGKIKKFSDILENPGDSEEETKLQLKNFYIRQTREITKQRVAYFEKIIQVSAKSIEIVDSKHTWGTCNNHKELTFNYKLSMAAPAAIDYVIIHELCHMHHLNHDRAFWRKVGSYDKDYKAHQDYLNRLSPFMTI